MSWQPTSLENDWVKLIPLKQDHFNELYAVASDPLIWEQHPNKNRYQLPVFKNFFEGALASNGAFLITDAKTKEAIGSSRFCNFNKALNIIEIGYTFYARKCWGLPYNQSTKELMINFAFGLVDCVLVVDTASNTISAYV